MKIAVTDSAKIRASAALLFTALPTLLSAQQSRPDTASADTARARRLAPIVVSGARLAPATDPRLPTHVERLDIVHAAHGASAAAELLQRLPGVSVSNDQGSSAQPTLELRGFTLSPVVGVPQGVSVFLDGVRVNEPDAQEVNFDLLPMEAVERAELVPGASAIYGKNSLAGALVLRTARGDSVARIRTGVEAGSFGERNAHLLASGMLSGVDGLVMVSGTSDDGYQAQSGSITRQLFGTIGHRTGTTDAALSVLYAHDELSEAGSLPESWIRVARRANFTGGDYFRPDLLQVSVRGDRALGDARLRGTAFVRRNAIEQLNVNAGGANTHAFVTNNSAGGTAELAMNTHVAGLAVALTAGGELSRSRVDYRVLAEESEHAAGLPDDCEPAADGRTALCEDARARGDDAALYGQGIVQVTPAVSLLLSARGDLSRVPFQDFRDASNSGDNTFRRVSPKIGATWLHAPWRVYASAGSAFRPPAALELACASPDATCPLPFSLGADPALRPVVAWSYDAGTSWSPAVNTSVSFSLYHADVHDEIVFVSDQLAAGYFQNVPRTRRDGFETSFTTPLPVQGLRAFGSYAFTSATYRSTVTLASALDDNTVRPGSQFAQSPRHRATAGLGMIHAAAATLLDAELSARAVSSSYLRGDEANRMPPLPGYVVGDARLTVRRDHLSASLQIANLFDRRYEIFGTYAENPKGPYGASAPSEPVVERFLTPAYPRTVTVGFSLER